MARVLIVDDEARIRSSARRVLIPEGHEVEVAADGDEALRVMETLGPFDVALVDYQMSPGPYGDVVLSRIRDRDPACARVLMTANIEPSTWIKAVNVGQIDVALDKPFEAERLIATVAHAIKATDTDLRRRRKVESATRKQWRSCVDDGLLSLHIQPIVQSVWPHGLAAVECLIRSKHPVLSRPDLLLNAVDEIGAVFELGAQVNRLAARWAERIPPEVLLFVNVHPGQFADPELMATFAPLLPHAGRVVLEITERSDLQENSGWERQVDELSAAGFQFALDDLGAGFNSLAMLAELRPTFIKIDMSITRGLHLKQRKQGLVELITKFAAANGERVVGEGVETEEEAHALRRCGVDLLQGYLYGRPTPDWPLRTG